MENKMRDAGITFEFLDGVDGNDLDAGILQKIQDEATEYKAKYNRPILAGEIGAAYSHLNAYKKIVDERIDLALILEDDIDFDDRLANLLKEKKATKKAIKHLDLILLGYSRSDLDYRKKAVCSYWGRSRLYEVGIFGIPVLWYWAAIGYLIKYDAAQKMLGIGEYPTMQADYLTANSPVAGVKLGVSLKPLIWPGILNNNSTIGDRIFEYQKNQYTDKGPGKSGLKKIILKINEYLPIKENYYELKGLYNKLKKKATVFFLKLSFNKYQYLNEDNI